MNETITRRELLQNAAALTAGGITFLALTEDGRVAFAESETGPLPLFQVAPYLQPGADASGFKNDTDSLVIAWQTNRFPAEFALTVAEHGKSQGAAQTPVRTERYRISGEDGKDHYHYAVSLSGLRLNTRHEWRLLLNGQRFAEGIFTTRKRGGDRTRCVIFGDNSFGDLSDRHIAYQSYRAEPDFVLNTGDTVYDNGLAHEFTRLFFPVHNADIAHARVGAPLMRSLLYYCVLGNHDLTGDNAKGIPCANFDAEQDAGGYFTALHLPENGPADLTYPLPLEGNEKQVGVFRNAAGSRYPRTANYSFDFGDGHFLCLDSNTYVDPTDAALQKWIEQDLNATDAAWKFVTWHHPPFNLGRKHYKNQHMRVLSPLLERCGVDVVFHGHEHVYQRTRPLKFQPGDVSRAHVIGTGDRLVPGTFTVDRRFDGVKNTVPEGVIYVVSGAGGKYLYDAEQNNAPETWTHPEDNSADYGARFISDRHSLTIMDMDAQALSFRQIDEWGNLIDTWRITKK